MIDYELKKRWDIDDEKLLCLKKERNSTTCVDTNEPRGTCAKWDKPHTGWVFYDSTYVRSRVA